MKEFFQILNSIYPLSAALQEHLSIVLKHVAVQKKNFLLREGQISKSLCYIEKGLVRCFYNKNSKEVSSWFMKEGDMIISVESFFHQKQSYESIQALEECSLICIGYEELQFIYRTYPELNFIARVLTEKYYTLSEQRLYSLRMQRAPSDTNFY